MTKIKTPFGEYAGKGTAATPATGTLTVEETGVDSAMVTTIDIADLALIVTTNASKADGKLLYTLPAGNVIIKRVTFALGITGTAALNAADTPDVGFGTTVASGVAAVISGTGAFENILTGQTWSAACAGVVQQGSVATTLAIATAGDHTIYLNLAAAWTGVDAGMKATGRIIIEWAFMS